MSKEQKCILCEIVYSSKQAMEEHMRSMLHHRELGILKGRDCRHECRVCGVTTSSLTEYASHISSFQHKQRVDDQKRKPVKEGKAEEYFDKETVKLIEERKEMRKEETFQKQTNDKQEHWQELPNNRPLLSLPYPPFPPMQNSAMGRNWQNVRFPPQNPNQWFGPRCATWHGEGPPDMQMWQSSGRRGKFWGAYDAQPRKRYPWNNGQFDFPWDGPIASHPRRHKSPIGKQKRPFNISDYQYLSFEESSEKRNFYKNHQTSAQGREYTRHQPPRPEKTPVKDYQNAHNSTKDAQITFENNCQLNIPDHPSQGNDLKKQQSFKSGGSSSVGRLTNSSHFTSRTNVEDHNLSEILQKAKETLLERTNSIPENHFKGTKPMTRTEDPQHIEPAASAFTNSSESKIRPTKRLVQKEQAHLSSSNEHLTPINISVQTGIEPKNTRPSLQSLQVSTSTVDQGDEKACAQVAATNQPVEDQDMNGGPSHPTTGSSESTLGKLSLPASLKRDLNRHMSTKGKALAHEPNLNSARRIRTVSETRKSDPEKDSALKPNLRQLLNSSSSRRGVNWNQVYHEVNRNKQGKGLPRFGIEMVPCEPEGLNQMDESELLSEGFQWDTVIDVDQITSCNQSLIESSTTGVNGAFGTNSHPQFDSRRDSAGCGTSQDRTQEVDSGIQSLETSKDLMDLEVGEITSDAELNDTQGSGMKRRAAGDVVASGIPNEVRKNKRQKIKKRSQVDQLMTLSLREEELSSSLQSMDNTLIQARAALESAYLEVQRLLMVKQQVTAEMSSLRTKRIEILHGMQGEFESPERETIAETQTLQVSNPSKPHQVSSNVAHPPSAPPLLPSATVPVLARIKQEPKSVFESSLEANLSKNPISDIQTTTSVQTVFASCQTEITSAIMPESVQETSSLPVSSHKRSSFLESKQSSQEKPAETRVKQVQKRKKRKCFKKATGTEEPELSESELDAERSSRPIRKIRHSRRSSGTSSSHSTLNEKDHMQMPASQSPTVQPQKDTKPAAKIVTRDSDSSELEMMDLPPPAPTDFVNLVSSDPEDGSPSKLDKMSTTAAPLPIDPKNLACNEVTSTSEINSSAAVSAGHSQRKSASVATDSKGPSEASDAEEEELPTEGEFEGHLEAVHGMQIHNGLLYTCSGDRTIRAFNIIDRKCVAVFRGHSSKVNCLLVTSGLGLMQRLYSGSSDQTIRCYNLKSSECVEQLSLPDRVLCLHSRWTILYVGLANGFVTTFSLKTNKQLDVFECHGPRAVSCLATAQEGSRHVLLVGSYDATISVRDATNGLLLRTLEGHTKTVLCMKVVNDLVFSGSSDQSVHAHNIHTGELVRIYKGHSHAVTVVAILGKVMVTACLDKLVRVYELQSHDRLQVYGGHSDMVMCMLIHKSMIYTGCYDGSVKAVKLNLIQNYRCWWHGCTLIFGVMEHLKQHLLNQHICPTQQMFKCRWRNCDTFFMRNQAVLSHMHKHVEDDSKMEL